MQYPSFAEYADALQLNLDVVLADPVLARGMLRRRASGLPVAHGGTFALTFEIETDHGKYALRCFHKRLDALHERYDAITKHLAGVRGPYLVGCQFQPQGITTESGTYPVVRMDWVDGQSLAAFVADHLQDSCRAPADALFAAPAGPAPAREQYRARRHPADQHRRPARREPAADRLRRHVRAGTRAVLQCRAWPAKLPASRPAPSAFQRKPRRLLVLGDRSRARRAQPAAGPLEADRQRRGRVPAARGRFRRAGELGGLRPAGP